MSGQRVVLLVQRGDASSIVYNALAERFNVVRVIMERAVPRRTVLRRRVKKLGLRSAIGQLAFRATVFPVLARISRARVSAICSEYGLNRDPIPASAVAHVDSVNSERARDELRKARPALVVVNGTRIISKETLECVSVPFLNTHAGITPLYRGVHGGYWALAQRDAAHCGVTVHLVDTGIDTGGILAQAIVTPTAEDTFATYPYLQYAAAVPLLRSALADVLSGVARPKAPPAGESRLWSHPTLGQYLRNLLAGTR